MMTEYRKVGGKLTKQRKGIAIGVMIMFAFFIFSTVFAALLPKIILTRFFTETIAFELNFNMAQRALQSVSSVTQNVGGIYGDEGKTRGSKVIGEYLAGTRSIDDINFVQEELDRMVNWHIFNCYRLANQTDDTIMERDCSEFFGGYTPAPEKYRTTIPITTPDGVQTLILVVQ